MNEARLMQAVDEFLVANREAIAEDIGKVVAVRSVEAAAEPGAPFGAGVRRALDVTLEIARGMGLATHDGDGYVGWAELPGTDERHIATITHVDVVPEGEGWDGDAYTMRQRDGWLIGRGVVDDKGPGILCLYLAKFFKELGEPPRYGIRTLFGGNEESGMGDLPYYLERNPQPVFCFTPDADFPVCHGEKGHQNGVFASKPMEGNIVAFSGGIANNVIPDRATCLVKGNAAALQPTERVAVESESGMVRLNAKGIGGHAAMPEGSINAIGLLVNYLLDNGLCTAEENEFLELLRRLHSASDGSGIGINCDDGVFTPLTCIGGIIERQGGSLRQSMDIRFPTAITGEELRRRLSEQAAAASGTFEGTRGESPFLTPADAAPIRALLSAYNEISGEQGKAFTMGGGTYARHFTSGASFGPEEQGTVTPDFVGTIHGANEGMHIDTLLRALKIYILAMWRLQQLEY